MATPLGKPPDIPLRRTDELVRAMFDHPDLQGTTSPVLDDALGLTAAPAAVGPDADPASLGLQVEDLGAVARLCLAGELDLATSALLDAVLSDLLRKRRAPRLQKLIVDTTGVTFVDAAGVSPLLHARAVLIRRGGVLVMPAPSVPVRRLLTLLGLHDVVGDALDTPA